MSMPARTSPAACARARSSAPELAHRLAGGRLAGAGVEHREHRLRREPAARRRLRELGPQPGGQGLPRRVGGEQLVGLRLELLDAVAEDGLHEGLARREVPVERADADARRRGRSPPSTCRHPGSRTARAPPRPGAPGCGARRRAASAPGPARRCRPRRCARSWAVLPPDPPDQWVGSGKHLQTEGPSVYYPEAPSVSVSIPPDRIPRGPTPGAPHEHRVARTGPTRPRLRRRHHDRVRQPGLDPRGHVPRPGDGRRRRLDARQRPARASPPTSAPASRRSSGSSTPTRSTLAALLLPAGALGDRFGRRGALIAGIGHLRRRRRAVGARRVAPTQLIALRALMGIGAALLMPGHAVDHHQRVPARGAGQGGRHLGRLRRRRRHARHPGVGRAARAVLLGLDLRRSPPRSPPSRCVGMILVVPSTRAEEHVALDSARLGAVGRRHRPPRARHHRRPRPRLDRSGHADRPRRRRRCSSPRSCWSSCAPTSRCSTRGCSGTAASPPARRRCSCSSSPCSASSSCRCSSCSSCSATARWRPRWRCCR